MSIKKIARVTVLLAAGGMLAPAVSAEDPGTMKLAPGKEIAQAISDQERAKQRGGFMGIAFSATFTATVDSLTGNVNGTGTSTTNATTGVTNTNPPVSFNVAGGQVQLSTYVGNFTGLNGVFNLTAVNGIGNIVNSHLTLNVALVTVGAGAPIPSLNTIFGQ